MSDFKTIQEQLYQRLDLSSEQSEQFFAKVVAGEVDPIILSSVLTALKIKGETPDEITGAAKALRAAAAEFPKPEYDLVDIVGTGGDGANTINISTTSAFVAAACGLKVAKHGNRSVSSKSGSSDLLDAMGIDINMSPQTARRALDDLGLCFLFAPQYHSGIRHAMPVRNTLKTRTIFNVLGPLINPAHNEIELMGVYDAALIRPIVETLKTLGLKRALVVHGSGLDEVAIHGTTQVAELTKDGDILEYELTPQDFGLETSSLKDIEGGTPEENRDITQTLLSGKGSQAQRNAVAANVGALLKLNGKANDYAQGAAMALAMMDSGQAFELANALACLTKAEKIKAEMAQAELCKDKSAQQEQQ